MHCSDKFVPRRRQSWFQWFILGIVLAIPLLVGAAEPGGIGADKLLKTAEELADMTRYLEALDLLEEARGILESDALPQTALYGDVLFSLAHTKIKGRLHQNFSAYYVKSALQDVQAANKLREKLPNILPQRLAAGYYLEGLIQKRFFMRTDQAEACFLRAVSVDPGAAAAKRELSELIPEKGQK
jgi:tetratricopeptide (TPR) repeat protein